MAKRKKAKVAVAKKGRVVGKGRWAAPRKGPRKPRARVAVEVPLPGMEQIRDVALDRICKSLAEEREDQNESKRTEEALKIDALKRMHTKELITYRAAGIELFRQVGAEKLSVRLAKGESSSGTGATPAEKDGDQFDEGDVAEA